MMKPTLIASCLSAMALSADLLQDFSDEIQGLEAQQETADQAEMDLLSSVMQ